MTPAVCSACFGSPECNFVSRTTIICRSLWQFMQQVDSTRGISSRLFECRQLCFPSPECKLLAVGGIKSYFSQKNVLFEHCADLLKLKS